MTRAFSLGGVLRVVLGVSFLAACGGALEPERPAPLAWQLPASRIADTTIADQTVVLWLTGSKPTVGSPGDVLGRRVLLVLAPDARVGVSFRACRPATPGSDFCGGLGAEGTAGLSAIELETRDPSTGKWTERKWQLYAQALLRGGYAGGFDSVPAIATAVTAALDGVDQVVTEGLLTDPDRRARALLEQALAFGPEDAHLQAAADQCARASDEDASGSGQSMENCRRAADEVLDDTEGDSLWSRTRPRLSSSTASLRLADVWRRVNQVRPQLQVACSAVGGAMRCQVSGYTDPGGASEPLFVFWQLKDSRARVSEQYGNSIAFGDPGTRQVEVRAVATSMAGVRGRAETSLP